MTPRQLSAIMPLAPLSWVVALCERSSKWGIVTPAREAAFIGHLAHECAQFTRLEEQLSYSLDRLMAVWPKRFLTPDSAAPYIRHPEALANNVYAYRLGNGPESSGDGYRYRGRGPIQLTGKANYEAAGKALGQDLVSAPELVLAPAIGVDTAGWFWQIHGLNELADGGTDGLIRQIQLSLDELDNELTITERINGARVGFNARLMWITRARTVLIQGV